MAQKLNAGEYKRTDAYAVDPYQVIVKEELRGRHFAPTDDTIVNMAMSIMEHGQRQPVECRRGEEDRLHLILGFTRTAAVRLIRTGFKHPETGDDMKDESFMLKVLLTDVNDQKAFIHNIVENAHRNETSPIDDAFNQNKLRDNYAFNDTDIAKLYQYNSPNKVYQLRKLLSLPENAQNLIHFGLLTMQGAIDILDIEDETLRNEALAEVIASAEENGKVKGSTVRSIVRDKVLNDDDGILPDSEDSPAKSQFKPLSSKELKSFWEAFKENEEISDTMKKFASSYLKFMAGRMKNETMMKHCKTLSPKIEESQQLEYTDVE